MPIFLNRPVFLRLLWLMSSAGFVMPKDYRLIFPDSLQLWRGFFLKNLIVQVPSELGNGNRPEIKAVNILIDYFGISGKFSAEDIISLDHGNASGWPFSISSLERGLVQSKLASGELAGMPGIPFLDDEPVGYTFDGKYGIPPGERQITCLTTPQVLHL